MGFFLVNQAFISTCPAQDPEGYLMGMRKDILICTEDNAFEIVCFVFVCVQ